MLACMKKLWFVVMLGAWVAFFVLVAASPSTLLDIWDWVGGLSWPLEVLLWIVFLPWMLALAVWRSGWPDWLRWLLIVILAAGWTAASRPKKR